ncbi:MAG: hypothetical protein FWH26_11175 [Oscillospiraceae bacterium]|nr:hypothetical protein [Oscillospiraceae bacterium]
MELDRHYYRLALSMAARRDLSGAASHARTALAINGENGQAKRLLEICLYELGEPAPVSNMPCDAHRGDLNGQTGLGDIIHRLNDLRARTGKIKRRKAMRLLKGLHRQSVRSLNMQGCLCAIDGKYRKAARFFALALEKDRGSGLAAAGLAEASKRRGLWRRG